MKDLNYQQALERIEVILAQLEEGKKSVDELSELVKEATEFVSFCKKKLKTTEEEIQKAFEEA